MRSALGAVMGVIQGLKIKRSRHTVDDIQETTSKSILGERILEARLLPESLQVSDPRAGT